jgi:hypothetical protein
MQEERNESENDKERIDRLCTLYDCSPGNIPTKVVYPGDVQKQ